MSVWQRIRDQVTGRARETPGEPEGTGDQATAGTRASAASRPTDRLRTTHVDGPARTHRRWVRARLVFSQGQGSGMLQMPRPWVAA
jgi:hypothetical protein